MTPITNIEAVTDLLRRVEQYKPWSVSAMLDMPADARQGLAFTDNDVRIVERCADLRIGPEWLVKYAHRVCAWMQNAVQVHQAEIQSSVSYTDAATIEVARMVCSHLIGKHGEKEAMRRIIQEFQPDVEEGRLWVTAFRMAKKETNTTI
ncbi:MAG TPA: hypothetical protein PK937_15635 [bacterium]|nr:hypothetical protein [bacterium]HNH34055.1 hypothetical protein [bacterium]